MFRMGQAQYADDLSARAARQRYCYRSDTPTSMMGYERTVELHASLSHGAMSWPASSCPAVRDPTSHTMAIARSLAVPVMILGVATGYSTFSEMIEIASCEIAADDSHARTYRL
jgi:hypothetical protein